jgi:SAM-dependent methyltransferase
MTSKPLPPDSWIQRFCPSPRRFVQSLVLRELLQTGLDVGCNTNSLLSPLRGRNGFRSTGVDAYEPALDEARRLGLHDEYIHADIRSLPASSQFDIVVASHVLEHIPRDDASSVLRKLELLARRILYIETPLGFLEQTAHDGNPFQRHLSGWFPTDFEARGYTVFGLGIQWLRGPQGRARHGNEAMVRFVERGAQWMVFRRPLMAHAIAGIRYIDRSGDVRSL